MRPDFQVLYAELKDDLQGVAGPLFDFAVGQVRKRNAFLPFGASLSRTGQGRLQAATSGEAYESSVEVLPILHSALRDTIAAGETVAVAVCEWVTITLEGGARRDAVKVLVEHERGLTVAFYLPGQRRRLRGWEFGEMMVVPAEPEVRGWGAAGAT